VVFRVITFCHSSFVIWHLAEIEHETRKLKALGEKLKCEKLKLGTTWGKTEIGKAES